MELVVRQVLQEQQVLVGQVEVVVSVDLQEHLEQVELLEHQVLQV